MRNRRSHFHPQPLAKYDAWNRLMRFGGSSETFTYDALGRRITSLASSTTRHLYYSKDWQVLEERLNTATAANIQNIWGLGYVDAMVVRDRDADSNVNTGSLGKSGSGLEERFYAQQDANFNVTSLTNTSGTVQERYQYDPYGAVTILTGAWGARGSSSYGWIYLHQGGRYDSTTKLYAFRHRDYSPTLQRWMQEDPLGYVDGMNLYEYLKSNSLAARDPLGLRFEWPNDGYIFGLEDPDLGSANGVVGLVRISLTAHNLGKPPPAKAGIEVRISVRSTGRYEDEPAKPEDGWIIVRDPIADLPPGGRVDLPPNPDRIRGWRDFVYWIDLPNCLASASGKGRIHVVYAGRRSVDEDVPRNSTTGVVQIYEYRWSYSILGGFSWGVTLVANDPQGANLPIR